MSASALLYETTKVLGKRRAEPPQFLTLRPATFAHNTPSVVSTAPVIINGKLLPHTKKRYQCTYNGCNNAYSKPSRLAEHERSHTGEVSRILLSLLSHLPRTYPSALTSVLPVINHTYEKPIFMPTHGATYLSHHGRSPATNQAVKNAFGLHNI